MPTDRPIVLIGPVAVGKSTVGPVIARRLDRDFIDVDDVANPIYESLGMGYDELFARCDADVGAQRAQSPACES